MYKKRLIEQVGAKKPSHNPPRYLAPLRDIRDGPEFEKRKYHCVAKRRSGGLPGGNINTNENQ